MVNQRHPCKKVGIYKGVLHSFSDLEQGHTSLRLRYSIGSSSDKSGNVHQEQEKYTFYKS